MAQAAEEKGDVLVLTSDNPRTEDPQQILDDLEGGLALDTPRHRVENRREAIRLALEMATPRDLVLVAGKGHERGQTVGREVLPFDERDVVASLVADLAGGGR
jgi:UDP-N-acetylmuramoyl-L-alanyl-D-glutamate--2,6-diaminopimelate ligase